MFNLIKSSFYKQLIEKKTYLVNTIISIVLFYVIFVIIYFLYTKFNISALNSPLKIGKSFEAIMISYYAWTMILSVYTNTGYIVTNNRSTGTIENLIVCTKNFKTLLIIDSIVNIIIYYILSWLLLFLFKITCRANIFINFFSVTIIMFVGLMSILGLSLIIAGFTIKFRKVESLLSIMQFLLLGVLLLPSNVIVEFIAPFYAANNMLKSLFISNIAFFQNDLISIIALLTNSILFFTFGTIVFNLFYKDSKKKGLLNYY